MPTDLLLFRSARQYSQSSHRHQTITGTRWRRCIVEPLQRRQRPSVFSEVVGYLADLYDAWGTPEKAAEWRAKLAEYEEPNEQGELASPPVVQQDE